MSQVTRLTSIWHYDDNSFDVVSIASPVQDGPVVRQDGLTARAAVVLVADTIAPGEDFNPKA